MPRRYKSYRLKSLSQRQADVYLNPFSMSTNSPKIPDGYTGRSIGVQLRDSFAFSLGNAPTGYNNDTCMITLHPFLGSWGACHMYKNDAENGTHTTLYRVFTGSSTMFSFPHTYFANDGSPSNDGPNVYIENDRHLEKWRLVSCGLRIKNTNNDDQNDGYFVSVRSSGDNGRFLAVGRGCTISNQKLGGVNTTNTNFHLAHAETDRLWSEDQWVNNPTYISGKVKNISHYEWILKPSDPCSHEFKNVSNLMMHEDNYNFSSNRNTGFAASADYTTFGYNQGTLSFDKKSTQGSGDQHEQYQYVDTNFDNVFIKIHGTSNSKFLVESVANFEVVYDENAQEERFMTRSVGSKRFIEAVGSNFKRLIKPAKYNLLRAKVNTN